MSTLTLEIKPSFTTTGPLPSPLLLKTTLSSPITETRPSSSSIDTAPSGKSFESVPYDVQFEILKHLLVSDRPVVISRTHPVEPEHGFDPAILQVSKNFNEIGSKVLYSMNKFKL